MRIIIDLEDAERHGGLMTVTFVGGLGTPVLTTCCNAVGLQQQDKHFVIHENGRIEEVFDNACKEV